MVTLLLKIGRTTVFSKPALRIFTVKLKQKIQSCLPGSLASVVAVPTFHSPEIKNYLEMT